MSSMHVNSHLWIKIIKILESRISFVYMLIMKFGWSICMFDFNHSFVMFIYKPCDHSCSSIYIVDTFENEHELTEVDESPNGWYSWV